MRQRGDLSRRQLLGLLPPRRSEIPIVRRGSVELVTRIFSGMPNAVRITVNVETSSPVLNVDTLIDMLEEVLAPINMIYRNWRVTIEIMNRDTNQGFFRRTRSLTMGDVTGQFIITNIAMSQSAEVNNIDLRHMQIKFHLIKI